MASRGLVGTAPVAEGPATHADRPRIVVVGPDPSSRGGIAQFTAHLARSLRDAADVTLVSFRRLYPRFTKAGRQSPDHSEVRLDERAEAVLVPWLPWTWRTAARRIADLRPSLVVIQWWHPLLGPCLRYLGRRSRAAGARVVFVCHNPLPHERFPAARYLTRRALATADRVLTLSRASADRVRAELFGGEIEALEHPPYALLTGGPADGDGWRSRVGRAGPLVVFFGYVRPYKGLEDLLEAMPRVLARFPDASLAVAGPFLQDPQVFERRAAELGIADAVRLFPGYVANEDVAGLFAAADVVALPYRSASQSGVLPQAHAMGVPVVATSVGAIPEAAGEHDVLVPPSDPEALGDGLIRALERGRPAPTAVVDGWGGWRDAVLREAGRPQPAPRPAWRDLAAAVARVAVWGLVAYFLARVLVDAVAAIGQARVAFLLAPVLASTAIDLVARFAYILGWHSLLMGSGVPVPLHRSASIYASSELVRYLPGGVLHLAARYRLAAREGIAPDVIVTSTILDLGLRVVTGALVFLATLPVWDNRPDRIPLALVLLIPIALVALHPRTLKLGIRASRRILRRPGAAAPEIGYRPLLVAAGWYAAGWLVRGTAFYLLATAITPVPSRLLIPFIGAFTLSWVAGVLVIFAPSGLGVREATGAALLRHLIGGPVAAVIVLASRIQSVVVEVAYAWMILAWDRARTRRRHRGES